MAADVGCILRTERPAAAVGAHLGGLGLGEGLRVKPERWAIGRDGPGGVAMRLGPGAVEAHIHGRTFVFRARKSGWSALHG